MDQKTAIALINKAKAKGYANGNYKCLSVLHKTYPEVEDGFFIGFTGSVWHGKPGRANKVYDATTKVWAELLPTITKYEAERLLGKVII